MKKRIVIVVIMLISIGCYYLFFYEDNNNVLFEKDLKRSIDSVAFDNFKNHINDFSFKYDNLNKKIIDKKNHWEYKFSSKYFDIQIMYADDAYVIIYCSVSGIKNGYLLFPIKHNDLVLIERKKGNKIVDIESENGILNAKLINKIMYLQCYDPNVVRCFNVP